MLRKTLRTKRSSNWFKHSKQKTRYELQAAYNRNQIQGTHAVAQWWIQVWGWLCRFLGVKEASSAGKWVKLPWCLNEGQKITNIIFMFQSFCKTESVKALVMFVCILLRVLVFVGAWHQCMPETCSSASRKISKFGQTITSSCWWIRQMWAAVEIYDTVNVWNKTLFDPWLAQDFQNFEFFGFLWFLVQFLNSHRKEDSVSQSGQRGTKSEKTKRSLFQSE